MYHLGFFGVFILIIAAFHAWLSDGDSSGVIALAKIIIYPVAVIGLLYAFVSAPYIVIPLIIIILVALIKFSDKQIQEQQAIIKQKQTEMQILNEQLKNPHHEDNIDHKIQVDASLCRHHILDLLKKNDVCYFQDAYLHRYIKTGYETIRKGKHEIHHQSYSEIVDKEKFLIFINELAYDCKLSDVQIECIGYGKHTEYQIPFRVTCRESLDTPSVVIKATKTKSTT